ncbi:hypothetical protein SDRG_12278 [Saprolegnia diclina VS20]|uniref:Uncharacterized protein n=1 Tax=Saprolegnia diclina (strain VS20) TaxID=1156394 RepID=T0RCR8_SAPDV|nr:hypothetical protein SDRG_12278 [Saprolegnia diclina VS20]EQC29998.1 hypothetical protein SDRG_12278 [Saprolegnia diclina VS20]|eukprot:XP_008616565.1 hypothetical protein SDRG_12278 [Saprolegnia diclina VS20]
MMAQYLGRGRHLVPLPRLLVGSAQQICLSGAALLSTKAPPHGRSLTSPWQGFKALNSGIEWLYSSADTRKMARAAAKGDVATVSRLLAAGVDPNTSKTWFGATALAMAVTEGHADVVERLLAASADVNQPCLETSDMTPLTLASFNGHIDIVHHLLRANADVNQPSLQGFETPLSAAASAGHLAIVQRLIAAEADVNFVNDPTPCLDGDVRRGKLKRIIAAISVFSSMRIGGVNLSKRWSASADASFRLPFCGFVATWAAKVTAVNIYNDIDEPEHRDELSRVLSRCTNLKDVCIPGHLDLLEAVTSPAHCVSDLRLPWYAWRGTTLSTIAPLQRWLASGHARHLSLDASSPTLSSLRLNASNSVVKSLVAHGATLASLTKLDASIRSGELMSGLLSLLPLPTMKTLSVDTLGREHSLLEMLPHMPSLESLSLRNLELCSTNMNWPSFAAPSTLRTLTLANLRVSETSLDALFQWATSSTHLESVTFNVCASIGSRKPSVIKTVQRCIGAGVGCMRFEDCAMGTHQVSDLVKALRGAQARVAFELDLSDNSFLMAGVQALLRALATCTNVSIKLPPALQPALQGTEPRYLAKAKAAGVTIDVRDGDVYIRSRTTAKA